LKNTGQALYRRCHIGNSPGQSHTKNGKERLNIPKISEADIQLLEDEIDYMESQLEPMTYFVLPGGHTTVSYCHIARCVCRRAERLRYIYTKWNLEDNVLAYINRLSDYLFVLARKLSKDLGANEVKWIPEKL
jgi:cob(I)alamin adenosyltransferase